jgi:predicted MarR family transcription regulator
VSDPRTTDCDCVEALEQRAAAKGHELTVVERWAAREFDKRMNGLEGSVESMTAMVTKMHTTLYDPEIGMLVRQKTTLDRVAWTKWVFIAIAAVITFGLGTVNIMLLIRERLH